MLGSSSSSESNSTSSSLKKLPFSSRFHPLECRTSKSFDNSVCSSCAASATDRLLFFERCCVPVEGAAEFGPVRVGAVKAAGI